MSSCSSGAPASCAPMMRRRSRRINLSSCASSVRPSRSASRRRASRVSVETLMVVVPGIPLSIPLGGSRLIHDGASTVTEATSEGSPHVIWGTRPTATSSEGRSAELTHSVSAAASAQPWTHRHEDLGRVAQRRFVVVHPRRPVLGALLALATMSSRLAFIGTEHLEKLGLRVDPELATGSPGS